MSKPDECEENKEEAVLQNVRVTDILLNKLKQQKSATKFIYFSTDFIFGENGPHAEDALPEPLNFYGETKLAAENLVKESGLDYAIVRPVFIYGKQLLGQRPSFIHWVKNNLEADKKIKVVTDQQRTPTYALDICKGVHAIIEKNESGDFHLAGKDIISPYDMAITVADVMQLNKNLIEPVTAETFPEKVKRAQRSGLKIGKAMQVLQYQPVSYAEGVRLSL
jgi:dTDP-4-dehydrorhamnose reductase